MRQWIYRQVGQLLLERPVRKRNLASFVDYLLKHGDTLNTKLATVNATISNQKLLNHIIGIERWGQQRLKVFLGEPFVRDEYDAYRPSKDSSWQDLVNDFATTRRETVALAQQLSIAKIDPQATVEHNDFGPLTAKAWLRYFVGHSAMEARRLK